MSSYISSFLVMASSSTGKRQRNIKERKGKASTTI